MTLDMIMALSDNRIDERNLDQLKRIEELLKEKVLEKV